MSKTHSFSFFFATYIPITYIKSGKIEIVLTNPSVTKVKKNKDKTSKHPKQHNFQL